MSREIILCVVFVCCLGLVHFGVKGQTTNGTADITEASNNDTTASSETTSTTDSPTTNSNAYPYPYFWPLCDPYPVVEEWPEYPVYEELPGPVFEEEYPEQDIVVEPEFLPVYVP